MNSPRLIPVEKWEYSLLDVARGLFDAITPEKDELSIAGLANCIPVRSGRAALLAALKALRLPKGAGIAVPLYCCNVVFKSIEAAGCRPVFIDVDPATCCISVRDLAKKVSKADAIIAVHMFGNVCDMQGISDVAQGRPIIEDCAQSIGSAIGPRPTGSFGTVSFFSFRSGKYLSAGEGGALFTTAEDIRVRLRQVVQDMPVPNFRQELWHVVSTHLRSALRSRPLYGLIGYALWSRHNERASYSGRPTVAPGRIFASDLAVASRRLRDLPAAIERQRANAVFYTDNLVVSPAAVCHEPPNMFYNRYLYPIVFPTSEHRDLIAAYLHERGVGTIKAYQDAPGISSRYFGYGGDCPEAEKIASSVLVIPNHHGLKRKDVRRIADLLNLGWKRTLMRKQAAHLS